MDELKILLKRNKQNGSKDKEAHRITDTPTKQNLGWVSLKIPLTQWVIQGTCSSKPH